MIFGVTGGRLRPFQLAIYLVFGAIAYITGSKLTVLEPRSE